MAGRTIAVRHKERKKEALVALNKFHLTFSRDTLAFPTILVPRKPQSRRERDKSR